MLSGKTDRVCNVLVPGYLLFPGALKIKGRILCGI